MNDAYIRNVIEGALLAAGTPLPVAELARLFDENARPSSQQLNAALAALEEEYAGGVLELDTAAGVLRRERRQRGVELLRARPRALLEQPRELGYRQRRARSEQRRLDDVADVGVAHA